MVENKVNLLTEGFSVEKTKKTSNEVTISGLALPFDKTSRNGFSYRKESIIKNHKTLEGKNIFFNHDIDTLPIGKVESVSVDKKGMYYTAKLIPITEQEKAIIEKVKNGLLDKVSIQCMYENAIVDEKTGEFKVDVAEFLELSIVGVPGFEDTTLQAVESLQKQSKIKMAKKKLKEELKKTQEAETPSDDEEQTQEEPISRTEFEDLISRVSVLESRLDAMEEEETKEGSDEETDDKTSDNEEGEPKKEEKIKRQTEMPMEKQLKEKYNMAEIRYKRLLSK